MTAEQLQRIWMPKHPFMMQESSWQSVTGHLKENSTVNGDIMALSCVRVYDLPTAQNIENFVHFFLVRAKPFLLR